MGDVHSKAEAESEAIERTPAIRTGPMPSVPWQSLQRSRTFEGYVPAILIVAFAVLAGIGCHWKFVSSFADS